LLSCYLVILLSCYLAVLIGRSKSTHCYAFLRFFRTSIIPFSLHRSRAAFATNACTICTLQVGPCVPSRSAQGRRMLFIRFVNRAVQAVWRSPHEGRKQARDSGHSPFAAPPGDAHSARGSRSVAHLLHAANKLSSNPMAVAPRVTAPVSISIVVLPCRRSRS
jgi:hypothetical protein